MFRDATATRTLTLAVVDHIEADADTLHRKALEATAVWFTSPYWLGAERLQPLLAPLKGSPATEPPAVVGLPQQPRPASGNDGPIREHLAEGELATLARHLATRTHRYPPQTLADTHVTHSHPGLFEVVARALINDDPDTVRFVLIDGTRVSSTLAAFVAWCLTSSFVAGSPTPVRHGVRSALIEPAPNEGGSSETQSVLLPSVAYLLPLPAGVEVRQHLVDNHGPDLAVPIAIHPLTAVLLPEAAHRVLPLRQRLIVVAHNEPAGRAIDVRPARWVARASAPSGRTSPLMYRLVRVIDRLPQGIRHRAGNRFPALVGIRRAALRSGVRSDNPFVRRADTAWLADAARCEPRDPDTTVATLPKASA